MSEEEEITTPEEPQKSRPRKKDGTFMSNKEIETLQKKSKDAYGMLKENNKALMQGTGFTEKDFKGMNARQVNQFLLNFRKKRDEELKEEPEKEPNTPILGTPIGSGHTKTYIEQFLTMDAKDHKIYFEAPASVVLGKHKNQEEATKKWLGRQ